MVYEPIKLKQPGALTVFKNYVLTATRFFSKNLTNVTINVLGLSTGLFVFFLAASFQEHERNHDGFFADSEQIYGVYTRVLPASGFGVSQVFGAPPALGPLIEGNVAGVAASSRFLERDISLRVGEQNFFESVKFVDPAFTDVFQFNYLEGSANGALSASRSLIMTREAAMRYFGRIDIVGETAQLAGELDMKVSAVIEDLPSNSHFVYRFGTANRLQILAPVQALEALANGTRVTSSWQGVSDRNRIWLKLDSGTSPETVSQELSSLIERHANDRGKEILSSFPLLRLTEWNLYALSIEGVTFVSVGVTLATIVLLVAVMNYSNLFTAMIISRLRELAIRKMLGASRWKLSAQIFFESLIIAMIAGLAAVALIELFLPVFGAITGKDILFSALLTPRLITVYVGVILFSSLLSVLYPISIANRLSIVKILRRQTGGGRVGTRLRSFLVGMQYAMNAILGILMVTSLLQNRHLLNTDPGFESSNVVILAGVSQSEIAGRLETLKTNLLARPEVVAVAGASQHPFQEIHNQSKYSLEQGEVAGGLRFYNMSVGTDFFKLYDIDTTAGRTLDQTNSSDLISSNSGSEIANIVLNEKAVTQFGWTSPHEALGQIFYSAEEGSLGQAFRIVGVTNDANLLGLASDVKPFIFRLEPESFSSLSVKIVTGDSTQALDTITSTWRELFPGLPIQSTFLQEAFDAKFEVFSGINRVLIALSVLAIALASSGLYGLIAVLAERRKREIAIRKILGASLVNLMRLLSWQFTKPVSFALLAGVPVGTFLAGQYLNVFADRINGVIQIGLMVGLGILILAWLSVSGHVLKVARQNPANALRAD